uniref:Uncharacterized protein n=1 Tax=Triticum urartu TaxID=4572 RepID=A0A8R7UC22_TRIUA
MQKLHEKTLCGAAESLGSGSGSGSEQFATVSGDSFAPTVRLSHDAPSSWSMVSRSGLPLFTDDASSACSISYHETVSCFSLQACLRLMGGWCISSSSQFAL